MNERMNGSHIQGDGASGGRVGKGASEGSVTLDVLVRMFVFLLSFVPWDMLYILHMHQIVRGLRF